MGKDAAGEVRMKFLLNKARQRRAGGFTLSKEGLRMRGHHALQRPVFGAVALVDGFAGGHARRGGVAGRA